MDSENISLEDKCESMMSVVVESRKVLGKMCKNYYEKSAIMENKSLNLQLKTIMNTTFKSKHNHPLINMEQMLKDTEKFAEEIVNNQKRVIELKRKLNNTQKVVLQLKNDKIGKRLRDPITTEALLKRCKSKDIQSS